jgi:hypothetical protein
VIARKEKKKKKLLLLFEELKWYFDSRINIFERGMHLRASRLWRKKELKFLIFCFYFKFLHSILTQVPLIHNKVFWGIYNPIWNECKSRRNRKEEIHFYYFHFDILKTKTKNIFIIFFRGILCLVSYFIHSRNFISDIVAIYLAFMKIHKYKTWCQYYQNNCFCQTQVFKRTTMNLIVRIGFIKRSKTLPT